MKVKANKKVWLVFTIIILVGYVGLSIYQLINKEFDALNLFGIIFMIDSIINCIEK